MLRSRRNALTPVTAIVLVLLWSPLSGQAQQSRATTERALNSSWSGQSTCPSRSINYITQTLPQQCLRTDWSRETEAPALSSICTEVSAERSSTTTSSSQDITAITGSESQTPTEPPTVVFTIHSSDDTIVTSGHATIASSLSTTATLSQPEASSAIAEDSEADSPLDKANFLSFEEWKRQNLAKAGQSADHIGGNRAGIGEAEQRRRPGHINNALDSLGEDTEIEIDFGGFVSPGVPSQAISSPKTAADDDSQHTSGPPGGEKQPERVQRPHPRGKDAGKTCKERSNYASFDCAATVLKSNPECKGSNSVLVENKDSYMLNECSAKNKFFIVELCDDILIDTVVLANFEFFSSMFRTFRISVSDRYPVKLDKWRELGTFEAKNSREVQAFLVENPLIWARYIRVEFLTHFGNEYYCPVSLVRVHGTTMMEEFNHDLKSATGEDDPENEIGEGEEGEESESVPRIVTADTLKDETQNASGKVIPTVVDSHITSKLTSTATDITMSTSKDTPGTNTASDAEFSEVGSTPFDSILQPNMESLFASQNFSRSVCASEDQNTRPSPTVSRSLSIEHFTENITVAQLASTHSTPRQLPTPTNDTSADIRNKSAENSVPVPVSISNTGNRTKTFFPPQSSPASQNSTKSQPSATHPSPPNPTTQESFFKSVHKRLQLLESNSTLSLQYIEDQSRILRDAFSAVEKRQLAKTTTFLETLNSTVLTELRDFRNQYDQIWQSTVLELSAQRETSQREVLALSSRISLLADEIVFQKRIAILQFMLILLCLGLVLFSRNGSAAHYLELPSLAINRSSSNLSGFGPHFETPPSTRPSSRYGLFGRGNTHERSPSSPPESMRPSSRYGVFTRGNTHERSPSDESILNGGTQRPNLEFSPPTPTSQGTDQRSNGEEEEEVSEILSESSDAGGGTKKIRSSPATFSGKGPGRRVLEEAEFLTPEPDLDDAHTYDK